MIERSKPSTGFKSLFFSKSVPSDVWDVLSLLHEGWHGVSIDQLSPVHLLNIEQVTCLMHHLWPTLPKQIESPDPSILQAHLESSISNNIVLGGYNKVCAHMLEALQENDNFKLLLDSEVHRIDLRDINSPAVHFINQGGQHHLKTDHIICTIPLGVLKKISQERPEFFVPNLGNLRTEALSRAEMTTVNKVILKFDRCFWDNDKQMLAIKFSQKQQGMREWYNLAYFNSNDNVFIAMFHGKEAQFSGKTDQEIVSIAFDELKEVYGDSIPECIAFNVTRWDEDPYSCGSWRASNPELEYEDIETLANDHGPLSFAGEYLSCYPGTVHGGYTYGKFIADKMHQRLSLGEISPYDQQREAQTSLPRESSDSQNKKGKEESSGPSMNG